MIVVGISLTLSVIVIILVRIIYQHKVNYWKRHNVDVINFWQFIRENLSAPCGLVLNKYYRDMCRENKAFKAFEGLLTSTVIVQDLEVIKQVMVTNFDCFPERGFYSNPRDVLSHTIFRLDGEKWRPIRHKFTPSLSVAKIKFMFPTLLKVASDLVTFLKDECRNGPSQMEIYDMCARYTTDVIGRVLYGIECNSLKDPHTEFRIEGEKSVFQLFHPLVDQIAVKFSKFLRFINFRVSARDTEEFFIRIVRETLEYRENHNTKYSDLMDTMIAIRNKAEKNGGAPLTTEQIAGQLFALFQAGFETSASTMRFALYELARNPEIQMKARQEVQKIIEKHNNELTYEGLREMKYLNQVIMETMRRYPVVPCITRLCRRPCTLKSSSASLTIRPNTTIFIPCYGIHHNPDIYPEPEKYLPERFTDEEIALRPANCYFPFGLGPKVCLGEAFAKIETTLGLAAILSQFEVSTCEETVEKLSFDPASSVLLFVKGGIQLTVQKL